MKIRRSKAQRTSALTPSCRHDALLVVLRFAAGNNTIHLRFQGWDLLPTRFDERI